MVTANDILRIAKNEIGTKEVPANSNLVKYGSWYGLNGEPWCVMFVMWVFAQAGASTLLPIKTASCSALMESAKKANCWITKDYKVGDVVIFDWPQTPSKTDHCGIVELVHSDYVETIEGNTSTNNDSNGGEVMRRVRSKGQIIGAVRPDYDMNIDLVIEDMTDKQILRLVERIQNVLDSQPVSSALASAWQKGERLGITNGKSPNRLATRAQTVAMILRVIKDE